MTYWSGPARTRGDAPSEALGPVHAGIVTMNAPFNPKLAPGSIDFELVPVDAARAAHDEPPPGVESLPTLVPDYRLRRRRRPGPSDRALTGPTVDWLRALPPTVRPKLLCEKHARVANAAVSRPRSGTRSSSCATGPRRRSPQAGAEPRGG